jgi:hypothetical protein
MPPPHARHQPEREALVERLREALDARARAEASTTTVRLVAREGRRTREWVRAMRSVMRTPASYRTPEVPPEALWRVVEDAGADADARTGAALALAPTLDEDGRARMRVAAEAAVEPRLRVALETAATDAGATASADEIAAAIDAAAEGS